MNTKFGYLCPINIEEMSVQGQFGSSIFNYVRISLEGCDLGDECLPDEEVSGTYFGFVHLRAHPSLLGADEESVVSYS